MEVDPANVDGRKIETHEFVHSVEHQVNWSHVLGFLVVFSAAVYLGPSLTDFLKTENRQEGA
jgi:hypothetical protein